MAFIYDLADTWADAAVTFNGIKLNVTDNASAAASNLMDLQVGGVSRFRVGKGGNIRIPSTSYVFNTDADKGFGWVNQNIPAIFGNVGDIRFNTDGSLGFGANGRIYSGAANLIEQRNGTNAQTFNLYNTYTDASNYERGFMRFVSNRLEIGAEKAGTGTQRALRFYAFADAAAAFLEYTGAALVFNYYGKPWLLGDGFMTMRSTGQYRWSSTVDATAAIDAGLARDAANIIRVTNGSTGGGAMQLTEMTAPAAPAADNVRIYAEDDGAGKTRLMARFATGAAVQLAIEP
jgi:hypothetical protein